MAKTKIFLAVIRKSILSLIFIIGAIVLYFLWIKNFESIGISDAWQKRISHAFFVFIAVTAAYWVHKISQAVLDYYKLEIAQQTKTTLDDRFIPLFERIAYVIIWAIALIIILSHFGINISALITTIGVTSLAIALAAQDTISNIIAGFLIMIDQPFQIGDEIKLPSGERVEVLEIGIRRSKFKGDEDALIIVPNVDLSKSKIVNYSYREQTIDNRL